MKKIVVITAVVVSVLVVFGIASSLNKEESVAPPSQQSQQRNDVINDQAAGLGVKVTEVVTGVPITDNPNDAPAYRDATLTLIKMTLTSEGKINGFPRLTYFSLTDANDERVNGFTKDSPNASNIISKLEADGYRLLSTRNNEELNDTSKPLDVTLAYIVPNDGSGKLTLNYNRALTNIIISGDRIDPYRQSIAL